MNLKKILRMIEKPVIIIYVLLFLLVYIFSRFFLEIYTDHSPPALLHLSLIVLIPVSLYAAIRTVILKEEKWYGGIGYFIMYLLLGLFTGDYIIVNGDILVSSAMNKEKSEAVQVLDVHKVFSRRDFHHTSVTIKTASGIKTLEARPYAYFYLSGRKIISIRSARSFLGNDYVSTEGIGTGEKFRARWLHFKDQLHRLWIFVGMVFLLIFIGFLRQRYSSKTPGLRIQKIGFWKLMGIVIGILFSFALLLYIVLLLYMKFFTNCHC